MKRRNWTECFHLKALALCRQFAGDVQASFVPDFCPALQLGSDRDLDCKDCCHSDKITCASWPIVWNLIPCYGYLV